MTHYGTLRAWAFIATLVGVFGMIAAAIGAIVWAFEVDGLLADAGRPAHRAARRDLHRDDPDRARPGDARDRRRRRHGGRPLDAMADAVVEELREPRQRRRVPEASRADIVELGDLTVGQHGLRARLALVGARAPDASAGSGARPGTSDS